MDKKMYEKIVKVLELVAIVLTVVIMLGGMFGLVAVSGGQAFSLVALLLLCCIMQNSVIRLNQKAEAEEKQQ